MKLFSTWTLDRGRQPIFSVQAQINARIVSICSVAKNDQKSSENKLIFRRTLDQLQEHVFGHLHEMNEVNVSTAIHRVSHLATAYRSDPFVSHHLLMRQLIRSLYDGAHLLHARQISNVIWGLGSIRLQMDLKTQSFHDWEELCFGLVNIGVDRIRSFNAQNVSNLLVGLARLENQSCRRLLPAFTRRGAAILKSFKPQELGNTIWALASLRYVDHTDFLAPAFNEAERSISLFQSQSLALMLWSLAALHYINCAGLVEKTVLALKQTGCSTHTLSIALWSMQQLQIRPFDADLDHLINSCSELGNDLSSSSRIRDTVMSFVVLVDFGWQSPHVLTLKNKLCTALFEDASLFSQQDICNMIWAGVLANDASILHSDFLKQCFHVLEGLGLENLRDEDIRQFYQAIVHLSAFNPQSVHRLILPKDVEKRWKTVWCVRQATSPLPLWVASALVSIEDMGYVCRHDVVEEGFISTCIVNLGDSMKYAVEGITIFRCYRNEPDRLTARFRWKLHLLAAMGYEVICIEERQWLSLTSRDSKEGYLKQKIDDARANAWKRVMAVLEKNQSKK